MSTLSDRPRNSSSSTSPTTPGFIPVTQGTFDLPDRRVGQQSDNPSFDLASGVGQADSNSNSNPISTVPITPHSAARRNRPSVVDPLDTTRRVNYRPTALPMDHDRNVDDDAGGGRWLSEDEGGDTIDDRLDREVLGVPQGGDPGGTILPEDHPGIQAWG